MLKHCFFPGLLFLQQGQIVKSLHGCIVVNYNLLSEYLMSDESIFEVRSLLDFIETLNILGFSRSLLPQKVPKDNDSLNSEANKKQPKYLCYRFFHPNFNVDQAIPENLYNYQSKSPLKNTKRILNAGQLIQNLLNKKPRKEMEISKLKLAHEKLLFALNKQLDVLREEPITIKFDMEMPDYVKNNEIAGYYGDVSLEALTLGFQNYFPIYQEQQEPETEIDLIKSEEIQQVEDLLALYNNEEVISSMIEVKPEVTPTKRAKKRKYSKYETNKAKETTKALLHLQKYELMDVDDDSDGSFI